MVLEHIKQVKEKAFCVYIPASYMKHMKWTAGQLISLHPNEAGTGLEIVALRLKKDNESENECESGCGCCCER